MWLLIAFIAVPMIEIALFIQVGGFIGLWWTLLIVLLTAIAGSYLVRQQGLREIANLQRSFAELNDPTEPLAHGAMILFSGALLLTPGFFTAVVGISLLIPSIRRQVFGAVRSRIKTQTFEMGSTRTHQHQTTEGVIDGEFEEVNPDKSKSDKPSGWTQH